MNFEIGAILYKDWTFIVFYFVAYYVKLSQKETSICLISWVYHYWIMIFLILCDFKCMFWTFDGSKVKHKYLFCIYDCCYIFVVISDAMLSYGSSEVCAWGSWRAWLVRSIVEMITAVPIGFIAFTSSNVLNGIIRDYMIWNTYGVLVSNYYHNYN